MEIAVFGATGRTGRPLVEQALDRGHDVVAFARDPGDLPAGSGDREGLVVVEGDAYTGAGVAEAVAGGSPDGAGGREAGAGVDAVVSVLGQTDAGPDDLLAVAGRHVLDAMADHGVDRYVTLVGAGVREEGEAVSLGGRLMGAALKLLAGEVLDDAEAHVADVRASDRAWTVVRVPRLVDGEASGEVRHGSDLRLGVRDVATRANVAGFLLDCVEDDRYVQALPKVADP